MNESEMTTKPTLDTILERINAQGETMRTGFASIAQRLERIEIRFDRVEGMVLDVRADVRELRASLRVPG